MASKKISILLADVDGTLVDSQKRITTRAETAIQKLASAGIKFAVTSGRPPRGMKMIVQQVKLSTPLAAFNGGMLVEPETMKVLVQQTLDAETAQSVIERVGELDLDVWVYAGVNWYLNRIYRISVDYAHTNFVGGAVNADRAAERVILARFQMNFI